MTERGPAAGPSPKRADSDSAWVAALRDGTGLASFRVDATPGTAEDVIPDAAASTATNRAPDAAPGTAPHAATGRPGHDGHAGRGRRRLRAAVTPRRVALAFAITPFAIVGLGVGHAGDPPGDALSVVPAAESRVALAGAELPGSPSASPTGSGTGSPSASGRPSAVPSASSPAAPSPAAPSPTGSRTPAGTATSRASAPARPSGSTPPAGLTKDAEQLLDVTYATTSKAQVLDLYLPRRTGRAVPLVIDIHGGAFEGGDKSDNRGRVDALVGEGYAVASVDYRLSGEAPFPAAVRDVKAATRWLRASAARYGIDPGRFAVWGDSAGGYFAAMLGATSGRATTFDDASLGNGKVSSGVQAVVDFYGPVDFLTMDRQAVDPGGCPDSPQIHDAEDSPESRWIGAAVQSAPSTVRAASPLTYLRAGAPPFFVAHGKIDCNVPHGQSLELVAALKAAKVPSTLRLLDGAGHGGDVFDEQLRTEVISFLDRTFGRS